MTAVMTEIMIIETILFWLSSIYCSELTISSVSLLSFLPSSELFLRILLIFSNVLSQALSERCFLIRCSYQAAAYECLSMSMIAFSILSSCTESLQTYPKILSSSSPCMANDPSRYSKPSSFTLSSSVSFDVRSFSTGWF